MKIFTSDEIKDFEFLVGSKLPKYIGVSVTQNANNGYIGVSVTQNANNGYILTKLIFPDDSSGTTYVYCPNEDTVLDDDFAIHVLKNALNIAVVNLTAHLKLLSNLMTSL